MQNIFLESFFDELEKTAAWGALASGIARVGPALGAAAKNPVGNSLIQGAGMAAGGDIYSRLTSKRRRKNEQGFTPGHFNMTNNRVV